MPAPLTHGEPPRSLPVPLPVRGAAAELALTLAQGSARVGAAPLVFVIGTIGASLFLQRFAVPLGEFKISVVLFVVLALSGWGLLRRQLAFDHRRVILLLALACIVVLATGAALNRPPVAIAPRLSIPSAVNWLFTTSFAVLAFRAPMQEKRFFGLLNGLLAVVAAAGVLQFAAQFMGLALFSFRNLVAQELLIEEAFAVVNPLAYGSDIVRSNGFFLVEASVFSQVMALAIMVEVLWFRRPLWLALFLAGLLCSASGTGLLVLGVFAVQLLLTMGGRGAVAMLALGLMTALGFALLFLVLPELAEILIDRTGEFSTIGTSGYERFVTPFMALGHLVEAAPYTLLIGIGPGASEYLTLPYSYWLNTPVKVLMEYGLAGIGLYLALIVSARRSWRQRALLASMLVLLLLTGGYHQFPPVFFLVLLVITVARLDQGQTSAARARG